MRRLERSVPYVLTTYSMKIILFWLHNQLYHFKPSWNPASEIIPSSVLQLAVCPLGVKACISNWSKEGRQRNLHRKCLGCMAWMYIHAKWRIPGWGQISICPSQITTWCSTEELPSWALRVRIWFWQKIWWQNVPSVNGHDRNKGKSYTPASAGTESAQTRSRKWSWRHRLGQRKTRQLDVRLRSCRLSTIEGGSHGSLLREGKTIRIS